MEQLPQSLSGLERVKSPIVIISIQKLSHGMFSPFLP